MINSDRPAKKIEYPADCILTPGFYEIDEVFVAGIWEFKEFLSPVRDGFENGTPLGDGDAGVLGAMHNHYWHTNVGSSLHWTHLGGVGPDQFPDFRKRVAGDQ